MGISEHLTCFLRNLYAGQEATVRTLNGTTKWLKIEKGVLQSCVLSSCLFNLYVGTEATARTGRETADWFQIGKEYIKAVYCHPAYLTSVQSPS